MHRRSREGAGEKEEARHSSKGSEQTLVNSREERYGSKEHVRRRCQETKTEVSGQNHGKVRSNELVRSQFCFQP